MKRAIASQSAMTAQGVEVWVNSLYGKRKQIGEKIWKVTDVYDFKLIQDLVSVVAFVEMQGLR